MKISSFPQYIVTAVKRNGLLQSTLTKVVNGLKRILCKIRHFERFKRNGK